MTHIKRFFESNQIHPRLSVEEIEDFFLEFIENGDIHFYTSGIPIGQTYVAVYFILDRKFSTISDSDSMNRLTQILKRISDACTRWKLDWEFKLIAIGDKPGGGGPMQTQLEIRQPVPQIVVDQFPMNPFKINFESNTYTFSLWLQHDELTMDFYLTFDPEVFKGGSGANGKWLKPDWIYFTQNESDIIKQLEKDYSKIIPCQYLDKVQASRDLHYNHRKYKYKFKLLV
jgi:hypothetical protein